MDPVQYTGSVNDVPEVTTSPVVATVYDHLLSSINDGRLHPGDRVSDGIIAQEFGVSRTPVREALQKLRDIGVIEASANRFTRVAIVSPRTTLDAMTVWVTLNRALVEEVTPTLDDETIDAMEADHREFLRHAEALDFVEVARANFNFYDHLRGNTTNAVLARAITGVVYMVRLGSLHLPAALDITQLGERQRQLLDAIRARDVNAAIAAIDALRDIRIPQE